MENRATRGYHSQDHQRICAANLKLIDSETGRRDGWSSKMRVLQFNLQMLISMRRQLRGKDNCGARFNDKFKREFLRVRNRWRKMLHGTCGGSKEEKVAQLTEYKELSRYAFAFWEMYDPEILIFIKKFATLINLI